VRTYQSQICGENSTHTQLEGWTDGNSAWMAGRNPDAEGMEDNDIDRAVKEIVVRAGFLGDREDTRGMSD
jgi:hypothetical protein